jgi:hypothetical protein
MSTPAQITEAHIQLVQKIWAGLHSREMTFTPCAQIIADSEAKACAELRGALALGQQNCDDVFEDLRNERDQLRADCNNLRADLDAIKAIRNEETARAERAEAKVSNQAERIRYLEGATNHATGTPLSIAIARAERAEAELATERARLDSGTILLTFSGERVWHSGVNLRAAIDAAMKEDA